MKIPNILFDKMRPIIMKASGVPECLFGYQNSPSIKGAYSTVAVSNIRNRGQANQTVKEGDRVLDYDVRSQLIATLTVNFYRNGAMSYAQNLKDSFKMQTIHMMMLREKIGFTGTSTITNITELFSGNQEERAHIELYVYYQHTMKDQVNVIERGDIVVSGDNGVIEKSRFDIDVN